ncbi:MAG: alpha/beta fold hydrolase [Marinobacterium sp.]|nr:alpha/beta fold hydrolase [Marinobacterium sp.]
MKLFHQIYGTGEPLLILHGLFGTYENWGSQIKGLAEHFQVIAVDLRNHGRSPHADEFTYPAMAADVLELMDDLALTSAHILGHSMGGKVAMQIALTAPQRLRKLVVVDIAPVAYQPHHDGVFKGLFNIELAGLKSRGEADKQLAEYVLEPSVRAFLLKNLYRTEDKQFAWRMNLPVIHSQYSNISLAPKGTPFSGTTLFIKGANSDYLIPAYRDQVVTLFPAASYKVIDGAGHWPHAEKAGMFSRTLLKWLL